MARFVPGPVPVTEDIGQLERFLRTELEGVRESTDDIYALADFSLANFVAAGYGGIGQNDPNNPLPNITSTFTDFTGFDVPLLLAPKAVFYDFAQDGLMLLERGIWYFSIKLTLSHNELNAGRVLAMRFDNRTTGVPYSTVFRYGVGRNVSFTNVNLGFYFEVDPNNIGQVIGLELGTDGDTFTNVDCRGAIYQVHSVSDYKGDAFSIDSLEGK